MLTHMGEKVICADLIHIIGLENANGARATHHLISSIFKIGSFEFQKNQTNFLRADNVEI